MRVLVVEDEPDLGRSSATGWGISATCDRGVRHGPPPRRGAGQRS